MGRVTITNGYIKITAGNKEKLPKFLKLYLSPQYDGIHLRGRQRAQRHRFVELNP